MASTLLPPQLWTMQCSQQRRCLPQNVHSLSLRLVYYRGIQQRITLRRATTEDSPEKKPDPDSESLIEKSLDLQVETDRILDSEASQELLKDLADASARVTSARQALDEVLRREREVMEAQYQLENRSFSDKELAAAEALVSEDRDTGIRCPQPNSESINQEVAGESEVEAAETELREASLALIQARAGSSFPGAESQEIDIDLERIESGKAAAISGVVGTLAAIPVALTMVGDNSRLVEATLSLAGILVSCFLFGLTYRYIVRRDLGNTNLKAGAVAAFGLVRGIAIVDTNVSLRGASLSTVPQLLQAALDAGESVLIFAFAAIALDACFQRDILQPFPIKKQNSTYVNVTDASTK